MKKFIIQSVLLIIVIAVALLLFQQGTLITNIPFVPEQSEVKEISINNNKLKVVVADTQEKRSKGLGGRTDLAPDEGMLFIFDKIDKYPFWMKGLTFPLDFIWIKGDQIVDITEYVPPPTPGQPDASLQIYQSKEPINKVLEVNGGTVQRLGIKVGDKISLK